MDGLTFYVILPLMVLCLYILSRYFVISITPCGMNVLTLSMLRLLSSKAQGRKKYF